MFDYHDVNRGIVDQKNICREKSYKISASSFFFCMFPVFIASVDRNISQRSRSLRYVL